MNWWSIILLPLISAFTGWITIWLAINMLFHPQKPVKFLGITIQGVYPGQQVQLAQKLGKLVSNELLSFGEIEQKITSPENLKKIMPVVEEQIDEFLHKRLKEAFPMIGMFIGERTISQLKNVFMSELEKIFPVVMKNFVGNLQKDLNLEQMVIDRVMAVSPGQLEAAMYGNVGKQLRMVKVLGAVVGLVIGIVEVLLMLWLQS